MRVAHNVLREDWENIHRENSDQVQKNIQQVEQGLRTGQPREDEPEIQREIINCSMCGIVFNSNHDMKTHKKNCTLVPQTMQKLLCQ